MVFTWFYDADFVKIKYFGIFKNFIKNGEVRFRQ